MPASSKAGHFRSNNKLGGDTDPPTAGRLPKDFLSPQGPLDHALNMALPTRGPRPSSTHQWVSTGPALQEGWTTPQTSLIIQRADTRLKKTTILQPVEQRPQTQKFRQNEMAEKYIADCTFVTKIQKRWGKICKLKTEPNSTWRRQNKQVLLRSKFR